MKSSISYNITPAISAWYLLHISLFGLFFDIEDGRDMFLRNASRLSTDYTALHPRRYTALHNHRCENHKSYRPKLNYYYYYYF
jgi:hypothetical protein